jgi:Ala-tRNA(Pro) deacylase
MTLVTDHLEHRGARFVVLPHRPVETSLAEARATHLPPEQLAKVVILVIDTGPALAVVPADARLDLELAGDALAASSLRLAEEAEIERFFPEFELGAVPPLTSLLHLPVVIDPLVAERPSVTFPAGTRRESVVTSPVVLYGGGTVVTAPIVEHAPTPPDGAI